MKKILLGFLTVVFLLLPMPVLASETGCWHVATYGYHDWEQTDVSMPTCLQAGYYILECRICGEQSKEYTGGGTGHLWEYVVIIPPSCVNYGNSEYVCEVCGETVPEQTAATGHLWEKVIKIPPTCTDYGYNEYVCSACGETEPETIEPLGHSWIQTEVIEGSCKSPKYVHYSCEYCGEQKTDTLDFESHQWVDVETVQFPTCTSSGSMKTKCSVCGITGNRTLDVIAHKYGEWMDTTAATNHSAGIQSSYCSMCGKTQNQEYYPKYTYYRGKQDVEMNKKIQTMLSDCGYLNDSIDGAFGNNTEQAIKDFQNAKGLNADGIAWPQTLIFLTREWGMKKGYINSIAEESGKNPYCTSTANGTVANGTVANGTTANAVTSNVVNMESLNYCEEHQALADVMNMYLNMAQTKEESLNYAKLCQEFLKEEIQLLLGEWKNSLNGSDQEKVTVRKNTIDQTLLSKESDFNKQYATEPETAMQMLDEYLLKECTDLCNFMYE